MTARTTRVASALLACVALASALRLGWQWREAARLRAQVEGLGAGSAELARLRAENLRLRQERASPAELEKLRAEIAASPRLRAEVETQSRDSRVTSPPSSVASGSSVAPFASSPDAHAVFAKAQGSARARVDERYAELLQRLPLAPAQRERFAQVLSAREEAVLVQTREAVRAGQSPHHEPLHRQALEAQARLGAQIAAEFGAEVAEAYRAFEWQTSAQSVVSLVEGRVRQTVEPLAPQQKAQLQELLLQHAGPGFPGRVAAGYYVPPFSYYHIGITEPVLEAAAKLLSPLQIRALKSLRAGERRVSD